MEEELNGEIRKLRQQINDLRVKKIVSDLD